MFLNVSQKHNNQRCSQNYNDQVQRLYIKKCLVLQSLVSELLYLNLSWCIKWFHVLCMEQLKRGVWSSMDTVMVVTYVLWIKKAQKCLHSNSRLRTEYKLPIIHTVQSSTVKPRYILTWPKILLLKKKLMTSLS